MKLPAPVVRTWHDLQRNFDALAAAITTRDATSISLAAGPATKMQVFNATIGPLGVGLVGPTVNLPVAWPSAHLGVTVQVFGITVNNNLRLTQAMPLGLNQVQLIIDNPTVAQSCSLTIVSYGR